MRFFTSIIVYHSLSLTLLLEVHKTTIVEGSCYQQVMVSKLVIRLLQTKMEL